MTFILQILVLVTVVSLTIEILISGKRVRANPLGRPPIPRPAFTLAKISAAIPFILLVLEAALGPREMSVSKSILCACMLIGGNTIFAMGVFRLGSNLRVGLPQEETTLVTSGAYAFSRNPIYVGLYFILGASLLYAFSLLNLVCVITTVLLHHQIILAEERFLAPQFKDYEAYCARVRRYL